MQIPRAFLDTVRARLPYADAGELAESDSLAGLGLDSMNIVALLVDIEDRYDIELPDDLVTERTFETVGSLWLALAPLLRP